MSICSNSNILLQVWFFSILRNEKRDEKFKINNLDKIEFIMMSKSSKNACQ